MSDSFRVIKTFKWVGWHLGHIVETRNAYKIVLKAKGRKHLAEQGIDGRTILGGLLQKCFVRV
jgi:hypothetical protein